MFKASFYRMCLLVALGLMSIGAQALEQTINADSVGGRLDLPDPTQPAGWKKKSQMQAAKVATKFTLNYLLVSPSRRQAIVNGKKVSVGDWVDGARVAAIAEHEVHLQVDGTTRVLPWRTATFGKSVR